MEKKKNIYDMEMHEVLKVKNELFALRICRVPGGWIYYRIGENLSGVFVPLNAEFRGREDFFII